MKDHQFGDQFTASPLMSSFGTTPERPSSLSEPVSLLHSPSYSDGSPTFTTMRLGPKLSETVKGKLSLGAKIIQKGGRENIFRQIFSVSDGEKLLKASQCYLSTTAGPIAGILFISTEKVAFCSERSITFHSPSGVLRTPYKVLIPVKRIKKANESENVNKPAQKYIEIVTEDDFEFWFMGFVRYEKAFMNLQKAISMSK